MRLIITTLFLIPYIAAYCQNEEFTADRPGLSDAPDLISKRTFQLESGFDISKYNRYGVYQLSTNTLRYALNNRFEARLDFGIQYDPEQKVYGASAPALGLKTLLQNQKNILPKTALIVEWFPPSFSNPQAATGLGTELCLNHDLKNDDNIYYNAGLLWQDLKQVPIVNGLIGYNHEFTKVWQGFIELYYYDTRSKPFNL
ncbi:MAG: hypothetical protein ACOYVG_05230 [Bacteroidota bacterium]